MLPLLSEEPFVGNTLGFLAVDGTLGEKNEINKLFLLLARCALHYRLVKYHSKNGMNFFQRSIFMCLHSQEIPRYIFRFYTGHFV